MMLVSTADDHHLLFRMHDYFEFDTTSKVMWSQYETSEGPQGVVDISLGYSKQNRPKKKQIKLSMRTTQDICIDGQFLSGN